MHTALDSVVNEIHRLRRVWQTQLLIGDAVQMRRDVFSVRFRVFPKRLGDGV